MELHKQKYQLVSMKTQLEQNLASKVQDIRALKEEIQEKESKIKDLTKSNQILQSQVETLQLQVHGIYRYTTCTVYVLDMCIKCVCIILHCLGTVMTFAFN